MKHIVKLGWVTVAILGMMGFAPQAQAESIPVETAWAQGTNWTYHTQFLGMPNTWVYTPSSTSQRAPGKRAAVFHLAGCGQMTFQVAQAAGWPQAAEAYGMVVIVPGIIAPAHPNRDSPNVECFNYGYDGAFGVYNPTRNDPDHAAIIAAGRSLSEDPAVADLQIDPDQVYVAGLSAGGALAVQLGCMAPDVFSGVATAAAPGIGSAQGTAVMPPGPGYGANTMITICDRYAESSGAPEMLSQQVHAIISDNNGLPAGSGPFDTSKFNNQRIWDGDKFCPHIYQEVRAEAFAQILGLGAPAETGAAIDSGTGIGCAGGERSTGDGGEVQCVINDQEVRSWTAQADIWRDGEGRTRLVKIEQDTLRHAWASGPLDANDQPAMPTRDTLRAEGYINTSTGEFDRSRTGSALNGIYGTIYLNPDSVDFPMFLGDLWTNNNPRLGDTPDDPEDPMDPEDPEDPEDPPSAPPTASISSATVQGDCIVVSGTASDSDGAVVSASVTIMGLGPAPASISSGAWNFEHCGLDNGTYTVFATATDDTGAESAPSAPQTVTLQGGSAEAIEGTLTDHSNEGRVTRFTEAYFAYRDQYCTFENFTWTCDPFTLYRCEGQTEWTDQDPGCGNGETRVVSLAASVTATPETVTEGDAVAFRVEVTNGGPDAASATHAVVPVPDKLAFQSGDPRCLQQAGVVRCHLDQLGAGQSTQAELIFTATSPGSATLAMTANSAQSQSPVSAEAQVLVEARPQDPDPDPEPDAMPDPNPEDPNDRPDDPTDPEPDGNVTPGDPTDDPDPRDLDNNGNGEPIEVPGPGCSVGPTRGAPIGPGLAGILLLLGAAILRRR